MANDFNLGISVSPIVNEQKIQNEINKQAKNVKVNVDANIKSQKYSKEIVQYYKDLEKQVDSFNKKNINGIDLEIKKREEQARIFSNSIKAQMQESVSTEKKIQSEIKKTEQTSQKQNFLSIDKNRLNSGISSYLSNNTKLGKELQSQLIRIQSEIKNVDATGLKRLQKEFSATKAEANALGQTGDTAFTKLGNNAKQFLSYLGSATVIMTGINAIRNMVSEVKTLDAAMISLKKVTDESDATYQKFLGTITQSAKNLGSTVSDMVEMTATWAKLGYTIQESSKLAEVSTVYANVGEIKDTSQAVGDLITAMKAYGIEAKDSMSIADKFNEIGNKYATEAADLGEGLRNAASSLSLAGNDIDESLAMLTSMTEITQNASESGKLRARVA